MTLGDLRRLSVRKQLRIQFRLRNGMECVVTEHGSAQVPGLKGIPDFNVEEELRSASEFLIEPAAQRSKGGREAVRSRVLSRAELAAMTDSAGGTAAPQHEEE